MKKFIAFLIAITCVFAMFSCGNDSVEAFTKAMNATEPTVVELNATVGTVYGDLDASYVVTYSEDGSFTVDYCYDEFASTSEGTADSVTIERKGTVSCDKDGNYSDGGAVSGKIESTSGKKLTLKDNKMSAKVSGDGNVLTATVKAKNTKAIFGVDIASDVELVMTKSEGKIVSYTMTYTLESGNVTVSCTYK